MKPMNTPAEATKIINEWLEESTDEKLTEMLEGYQDGIDSGLSGLGKRNVLKMIKAIKKEQAKRAEAGKVKAGDIFYAVWGYDATNYDFVIVVKVSDTGKTALCQRASSETVRETRGAIEKSPRKTGYGGTFRLQVRTDRDDAPVLRGSYLFCNNEKRLAWLHKHKGGTYSGTHPLCA